MGKSCADELVVIGGIGFDIGTLSLFDDSKNAALKLSTPYQRQRKVEIKKNKQNNQSKISEHLHRLPYMLVFLFLNWMHSIPFEHKTRSMGTELIGNDGGQKSGRCFVK